MSDKEYDSNISEHYHRFPYPDISLAASLPREQLWQINHDWLARRCGIPNPSAHPKIWIAGCGTFQPYTLSQANPAATISATDLSESSLKIAKRRCFIHRKKNVEIASLDLNKYDSYPSEQFDWIECYGVLMSVENPLKTLKAFSEKLTDNGFIRIMVYPHYGRQRIFQIQEIARLLSLKMDNPRAPRILKSVMKALPDSHPLKYAFFNYQDSKNAAGIADAFLHPNDRAFTGIEISKLIDDAGLEISYCMHRPWGQPREMAEKLGLIHHDPALWLHYLDLWQSLRSNFILCLRKKNSGYKGAPRNRHELFDFTQKGVGIKHRLHLARLELTGTRLQTRTKESMLDLSSQDLRQILSQRPQKVAPEIQAVFPGHEKSAPLLNLFQGTSKMIRPKKHFVPYSGRFSPNPLYQYLYDAYTFSETSRGLLSQPLPSLREQIVLWQRNLTSPENTKIAFGLSPLGTYLEKKPQIEAFLNTPSNALDWGDVTLPQENEKLGELEAWLEPFNLIQPGTLEDRRKLWVLLLSHLQLSNPFYPT